VIMLSIDPALHGIGLALFQDGVLIAAGYAPNKCEEENIVRRCVASAQAVLQWQPVVNLGWSGIEQFVAELPQVYARGANKSVGDPNKNVLPLAMIDASLAALLPRAEVKSYQPHSWKGSTQKPKSAKSGEYVIMSKVKSRLSENEIKVVDWTKSVSHSWDVADAIGIGLFHLGRFERVRVFARE